VDVRVIAATHQDLGSRVREIFSGEDLLHRLTSSARSAATAPTAREDIPELLQHYLDGRGDRTRRRA